MKAKTHSIFAIVRFTLIGYIFLSSSCCSQDEQQMPVSQDNLGISQRQIKIGVTGRVTEISGDAVVDAMIVPTALSANTDPIPEIAITTDNAGRYTWSLSPGRYNLTVISVGHQKLTRSIEVKENALSVLNFVLEKIP